VGRGKGAIAAASPPLRPYMIALVFGMLGLAVCLFFGNLDKPWSYVWVYLGFTLRAAADVIEKAERLAPQPVARASIGSIAPRLTTRAGRAAARRVVGELRR
jgi:hypothetical protein